MDIKGLFLPLKGAQRCIVLTKLGWAGTSPGCLFSFGLEIYILQHVSITDAPATE